MRPASLRAPPRRAERRSLRLPVDARCSVTRARLSARNSDCRGIEPAAFAGQATTSERRGVVDGAGSRSCGRAADATKPVSAACATFANARGSTLGRPVACGATAGLQRPIAFPGSVIAGGSDRAGSEDAFLSCAVDAASHSASTHACSALPGELTGPWPAVGALPEPGGVPSTFLGLVDRAAGASAGTSAAPPLPPFRESLAKASRTEPASFVAHGIFAIRSFMAMFGSSPAAHAMCGGRGPTPGAFAFAIEARSVPAGTTAFGGAAR